MNRRRPTRKTPLSPGVKKDGCFHRLIFSRLDRNLDILILVHVHCKPCWGGGVWEELCSMLLCFFVVLLLFVMLLLLLLFMMLLFPFYLFTLSNGMQSPFQNEAMFEISFINMHKLCNLRPT